MVFLKIADMHRRLSECLRSLPIKERAYNIVTRDSIIRRFRVLEDDPGPIVKCLDSFERLGRKEGIEPVIDALWKIIGELQPYAHPEPRIYHWRFKYVEDDWRKIVNLLRQNGNLRSFGKTRAYDEQDRRKYEEEDWRKR